MLETLINSWINRGFLSIHDLPILIAHIGVPSTAAGRRVRQVGSRSACVPAYSLFAVSVTFGFSPPARLPARSRSRRCATQSRLFWSCHGGNCT